MKDLLFLSKIQNLNYDLRVLCVAEFLGQHPKNYLWFFCQVPITQPEVRDTKGFRRDGQVWSKPRGQPCPKSPKWRGRPGCVLWSPVGNLNLGHSSEALCFPGAAWMVSSQDHWEAQLQGGQHVILPSRWNGGLRNDSAQASPWPLPGCRCLSMSCLYSRNGKNQHQMVTILITALLLQVSVSS